MTNVFVPIVVHLMFRYILLIYFKSEKHSLINVRSYGVVVKTSLLPIHTAFTRRRSGVRNPLGVDTFFLQREDYLLERIIFHIRFPLPPLWNLNSAYLVVMNE